MKNIEFVGILNHVNMERVYQDTDCLIFPSRLETWGLPISEFLPAKRPIIAADEKYAHETVEGGKYVAFFPTNDSKALAMLMKDIINGDLSQFQTIYPSPFEGIAADSYAELFNILLDKKPQ